MRLNTKVFLWLYLTLWEVFPKQIPKLKGRFSSRFSQSETAIRKAYDLGKSLQLSLYPPGGRGDLGLRRSLTGVDGVGFVIG